ncbi:MAG: TIGR02450 family Trp-rich protein [Deltaproteobacteria bacterium]|nr:TIGR02450 family Trp-rich protein [Deltaproteobacteria bacterium]
MKKATQNRPISKHFFLSKWTAVAPLDSEKHFLAKDVLHKGDATYACLLEAVHTKRLVEVDWRDLKDGRRWLRGWR